MIQSYINTLTTLTSNESSVQFQEDCIRSQGCNNWLCHNRGSANYDIVKGAVADDKVYASLNAFENGFMDKAVLLKELKTWLYVNQISFHTQRALKLLSFEKEVFV